MFLNLAFSSFSLTSCISYIFSKLLAVGIGLMTFGFSVDGPASCFMGSEARGLGGPTFSSVLLDRRIHA